MWLFKRNNLVSLLGVFVVLLLFVLIRHFQNELFYDPLLLFYKQNFQNQPLPHIHFTEYIVSITFRFLLNSALSFGVLYLAFKDVKILKICTVLYVVVFVVLSIVLMGILNWYSSSYTMLLFYVRRFLIQPILLILVLPAFYYHKKLTKLKV